MGGGGRTNNEMWFKLQNKGLSSPNKNSMEKTPEVQK